MNLKLHILIANQSVKLITHKIPFSFNAGYTVLNAKMTENAELGEM
jgi:hypothetical protein